jgi:hypothetical protein
VHVCLCTLLSRPCTKSHICCGAQDSDRKLSLICDVTQAKKLEKSLERSEKAVKSQTKQLRSELNEAKEHAKQTTFLKKVPACITFLWAGCVCVCLHMYFLGSFMQERGLSANKNKSRSHTHMHIDSPPTRRGTKAETERGKL